MIEFSIWRWYISPYWKVYRMAQRNPEQNPEQPLIAGHCKVVNHGYADNSSVAVLIPAESRDILDISSDKQLDIHCFKSKLILTFVGRGTNMDPICSMQRSPVSDGASLRINVPDTARQILTLEQGELLSVMTYTEKLCYRRASDVINDGGER